MNRRQLIIAGIILIPLSIISSVFAGEHKFKDSIGLFNTLPEPRLIYPISDEIILTGKGFLEFRWWRDFIGVDHFVFKIYKGYNMYAPDLIYEQNLSSSASSIKVKPELFDNGQVYTWSLMLVSLGGQKSDKSFSSFKVVK